MTRKEINIGDTVLAFNGKKWEKAKIWGWDLTGIKNSEMYLYLESYSSSNANQFTDKVYLQSVEPLPQEKESNVQF